MPFPSGRMHRKAGNEDMRKQSGNEKNFMREGKTGPGRARRGAGKEGESIYRAAIRGVRFFGFFIILTETAAYTFSFLVSGLVRKDVFNLLEGKPVSLGILSLTVLILLDIAVPLLINAVKQINAGLAAKLKVRISRNVKRWLLECVLRVPLDERMPLGEGETISLFRNECEDVSGFFMEFYYQVPKIVLSCAILIVMFGVHPLFAAVSLCPTVLILALLRRMSRRVAAYRESARRSTGEVTNFLNTFLGNIAFFKMIGDRERVYDAFRSKCGERAGNEIRDRVFDRVLGVFSENASDLTLGVILLIAIPFFAAGRFTVGEFVMFEYYYAFLTSLPGALGSLVRKSRQTKVSVKRMEVMRTAENGEGDGCTAAGHAGGENARDERVGDGNARLENARPEGGRDGNVWHETVRYEAGGLYLSLEVCGERTEIEARRGQSILFVSENRQTGSELLRRLFVRCTEKTGDGLRGRASRRTGNAVCCYVPEDPVLFDESVRENICLDSAYEEERFAGVLEKTDLWEDVRSFPDGIQKRAGRKGMAVSGGQRKRIGIARALYSGAQILFLDGFSDQVDRATEEKLLARILRQFDGILLLASDSARAAEMADRVVRL